MHLSRGSFERILGPIQIILEAAKKKQEARRAEQNKQLEVLNLKSAARGSFGFEGCVSRADGGALFAVHLAQHFTTSERCLPRSFRTRARAAAAAAAR